MVLDKTLAMFEEVTNAHNRRKIRGWEKMSGIDNVNHPKHYELPGGGETIDFIGAVCGAGVDEYYRGNILKYVCRYKEKGGAESLKKPVGIWINL